MINYAMLFKAIFIDQLIHCIKRYSVSLRIQSECRKYRPEKTPYLDTSCSDSFNSKSNFLEVLFRSFAKFTWKHLSHSLSEETLAQVFPCEFCKMFNYNFFTKHLWVTTSVTNFWDKKMIYLMENLDYKHSTHWILTCRKIPVQSLKLKSMNNIHGGWCSASCWRLGTGCIVLSLNLFTWSMFLGSIEKIINL